MFTANILDYGASENAPDNAASIQAAIDACEGGGIVTVPAGTFTSGGLSLKSNITLRLEKGASLRGSADFRAYDLKLADTGWGGGGVGVSGPNWFDAFISGLGAENITIEGEGEVDGADCINPDGEEGFRGPHCLRFTRCRNISVSGVTIRRSANYAVFFIHSANLSVDNIQVRGGHDGVHAQRCRNMTVSGCDFKTGDDCIAGSDNENFAIRDCNFNTSCNGFRLGCMNLTVERCRFWGPGESPHRVSKRNNMLCAMVHFAPEDRDTLLASGNWQISDVEVDRVDRLYEANHRGDGWQGGKPATTVSFERVKASNVERPVFLAGKPPRAMRLRVKDSCIALREGAENLPVIDADCFEAIMLENVTLEGNINAPAIKAADGGRIVMKDVKYSGGVETADIDLYDLKNPV